MKRSAASGGFTLVETLIALAIIAGAMAATLRVVVGQAHATRSVDERRIAMLVAQSQLAALAAAADTGQFETRGRTSGVDWRVEIAPYPTRFARPKIESITVSAGSGANGRPLAVLHSLRLARP